MPGLIEETKGTFSFDVSVDQDFPKELELYSVVYLLEVDYQTFCKKKSINISIYKCRLPHIISL